MYSIVILVDSREKQPYQFSVQTQVATLATGDYSVLGFEKEISVERKRLDDFVACIAHHRKRFFAEVDRLAKMQHACIVVEGSLDAILRGKVQTRVHPQTVLKAAAWLSMRVPVYFIETRLAAREWTEAFLRMGVRECKRK